MRTQFTAAFLMLVAAASSPASDTKQPNRLGDTQAYKVLGELPVLHRGRIKPLDTMARLEVKDVYGPGDLQTREGEDQHVVKWGAVAALIDWPVRPEYWNQQEILLIDLWDYQNFKQELMASAIKDVLKGIAAQAGTSTAAKSAIETLLTQDVVTHKDLEALVHSKLFDRATAKKLQNWSDRMAEGRKRIAPAVLESAVIKVNDRLISFDDWFKEVYPKGLQAEASEGQIKLSPREDFVFAVGKRWKKYEGFRDRSVATSRETEIPLIPRPFEKSYVKYTGDLVREMLKVAKDRTQAPEFSEFDQDVQNALGGYLESYTKPQNYLANVLAGREKVPSEDAKFDRSFAKWLREASNWIPLRLLLESDLEQLKSAGLPYEQLRDLRTAFAALEAAEREQPGRMDTKPAEQFAAAARALGTTTSPTKYPKPQRMQLETHFNALDPFGRAPWLFGTSLVLLLLSLGVSAERGSRSWVLDRVLYFGGVLGLVAGIALEIYGFYLRVTISGWAPVTNMYETVIWVAFVAALLGAVLEAIFRRKYAATAASGTALLATLLAANVPLLEPNIGQLAPVLRDNFWLTVHVLTIVSSYAAFSLVMGLGLLGVAYYLSATYRNDTPYTRLARPLLYALPAILIGVALQSAVSSGMVKGNMTTDMSWGALAFVGPGLFLAAVALFALMGEFANRKAKPAAFVGAASLFGGALVSLMLFEQTPPTGWPQVIPMWFVPGVVSVGGFALLVLAGLGARSRRILVAAQHREGLFESTLETEAEDARSMGSTATATATATRAARGVSVAELVRKSGAQRPRDPRGEAIQATVSQIKPLSNFIYRAMQVGVLLVALGTFLGGVWADKSWGRFWGWDPKEVWALTTLIVYLVPLHGRFAGWVSTFGLVAASVICYNSVLMAWYGVNWVLGVGLHSYGFAEGGGQGIVVFSALALIALVIGAAFRRHLGSRNDLAYGTN